MSGLCSGCSALLRAGWLAVQKEGSSGNPARRCLAPIGILFAFG